jgi:hypothetical protein
LKPLAGPYGHGFEIRQIFHNIAIILNGCSAGCWHCERGIPSRRLVDSSTRRLVNSSTRRLEDGNSGECHRRRTLHGRPI